MGGNANGVFDVDGAPDAGYTFSLPNPATVELTGPTNSVPMMASLTSDYINGDKLDNLGDDTVTVFGVISGLSSTQMAGYYDGTYVVTVTYP